MTIKSLSLLAATMIAAASVGMGDAYAADVTFEASGALKSPSPLAGQSFTVFYTVDTETPPYFRIQDSGYFYANAIKAVTYSINGAPAISIGPIPVLLPMQDASPEVLLFSDVRDFNNTTDYGNEYQAPATSSSGYFSQVSLSALGTSAAQQLWPGP